MAEKKGKSQLACFSCSVISQDILIAFRVVSARDPQYFMRKFHCRLDRRLMLVSETWQRKINERPRDRNSVPIVVMVVWRCSLKHGRERQTKGHAKGIVFLWSWWSFDVGLWNRAKKDRQRATRKEQFFSIVVMVWRQATRKEHFFLSSWWSWRWSLKQSGERQMKSHAKRKLCLLQRMMAWRQATRKEQFFYRRDGRLMLVSETWQRKTDDRPHERNSFSIVVIVVWC